MMALRRGALVILVGLILPVACDAPQPPGPPATPGTVQLPVSELAALRARIESNLMQVARICKEQGITAGQVQQALFSTNWDDPQVDRLSNMPLAIRGLVQTVRDDFIKQNDLLVAAHDEAEQSVPVEGGAR